MDNYRISNRISNHIFIIERKTDYLIILNYNISYLRMSSRCSHSTRNTIFFHEDLQLDNTAHLSAPFNNRMILLFSVTPMPTGRNQSFESWMKEKWSFIPASGKEAFISRVLSFLQTQTVVQGESGHFIGEKVHYLICLISLIRSWYTSKAFILIMNLIQF